MRNQVCQHFRSLGIKPKESARYSNIIHRMIINNGKEFTVKRLKSLVETLKNNVKTGGYHIPPGFATRVNRNGDKIVKDNLIHRLLCAKTQNEIFIAQSVFKVHTLIMFDQGQRPSKQQLKKFLTAVKEPFHTPDPRLLHSVNDKLENRARDLAERLVSSNRSIRSDVVPLRYLPKGTKTSPVLIFNEDKTEYKGIEILKRDNIRSKDISILYRDTSWNLLAKTYLRETSSCIFGQGDFTSIFKDKRRKTKLPDLPVGTISYIQEPSCKLRAVANVNLAIQAMAEPLKVKTKYLIESQSQVDTRDHDAGRHKVYKWLKQGKTVYAFDASNFTERLPLKSQLRVLEGLKSAGFITPYDYDVFVTASKGRYIDTLREESLKYEVGQPQGFGPSFNVATLTHLCIVLISVTTRSQYDKFSIIGDDIVIADKDLADAYIKHMEVLGVEINKEKSLISDVVSEYAGKMITKEGIFLSAKIKHISNDKYSVKSGKVTEKLLSHMRFYGNTNAWKNFSDAQKYYAYKSILPLYMGGLDFKIPTDTIKQKFDRIDWVSIRRQFIRKEFDSYIDQNSRTDLLNHLQWIYSFDKMVNDDFPQQLKYTDFKRYFGTEVVEHASSGLPRFTLGPDEVLFKGLLSHSSFGRYDRDGSLVPNAGYRNVLDILQQTAITSHLGEGVPLNPDLVEDDDSSSYYDLSKHLSPINKILIDAGLSQDVINQFFDKKSGYIDHDKINVLKLVSNLTLPISRELDYDVQGKSPKEINYEQYTKPADSTNGGYQQPKSEPKGSFYPRIR